MTTVYVMTIKLSGPKILSKYFSSAARREEEINKYQEAARLLDVSLVVETREIGVVD